MKDELARTYAFVSFMLVIFTIVLLFITQYLSIRTHMEIRRDISELSVIQEEHDEILIDMEKRAQ